MLERDAIPPMNAFLCSELNALKILYSQTVCVCPVLLLLWSHERKFFFGRQFLRTDQRRTPTGPHKSAGKVWKTQALLSLSCIEPSWGNKPEAHKMSWEPSTDIHLQEESNSALPGTYRSLVSPVEATSLTMQFCDCLVYHSHANIDVHIY